MQVEGQHFPYKRKHRPVQQSFLQCATSHQGVAREHVAHDDMAASLHEGFRGQWVKGSTARDEAEALQARAAGQSLEEWRVGIQVGLL